MDALSTINRANGKVAVTDFEAAVLQRYGDAAQDVEQCLCLPVSYDKGLLEVIPREIIDKDYGCGDPSRYVQQGETVLDLGSGSGKACYIIAQIVGPEGKVIGVDFNPPMLDLARKYQESIGDQLGYHNVEFRRGKIQDLITKLELLDRNLHGVAQVSDPRIAVYIAGVLTDWSPMDISEFAVLLDRFASDLVAFHGGDLLHESGSIFVQIGEENVHRVRALMDEVFGESAWVTTITWQKRTTRENRPAYLPSILARYDVMTAAFQARVQGIARARWQAVWVPPHATLIEWQRAANQRRARQRAIRARRSAWALPLGRDLWILLSAMWTPTS